MPRIKIDTNAHEILKRYKGEIEERGIEGIDFSEVIRDMDRRIKSVAWSSTEKA